MSYTKLAKSSSDSNASHETLLPATTQKVPKLKHGNDADCAKELEQYIDEAESGLRSILKAGYFLECLAADLPHNQLGPWVEAHCKRKWRTVQRWKQVASGIADAVGIKYKARIGMKLHEVLSLPLNKLSDEVKAVREKIENEIAGKSYRQLFLELKQYDDDAEDLKSKRGRRKGQGGATKEQRAAAAAKEEQARIEELELSAEEMADWLMENADDKNLGMIGDKILRKLLTALTTGTTYINRLQEARKGGK